MASVSHDGGGFRRILFFFNGKRDKIHVGKISAKGATTIKKAVEELIEAKNLGRPVDDETARWLRKIDNELHKKLSSKGLVAPRQGVEQLKLGAFLDSYIDKRSDVKPTTKAHLERARKDLVDYFGADKPLGEVTEGDADEFRLWLKKRLGENTVRRTCGRARQFIRAAIKRRLIAENPFGEMKGVGVMANKAREYFVTREEADKVLEACPDAQWRLLFALSRYGGLRCPSEHLGLRWGDIDWERGRMTVRSPKTEHHEGRESRVVPIFPEIRPYLDELWDDPEAEKSEFVITRYRSANSNLRTQLERIIRKAGLKPWPKLFQNLRSTRQTELAETFPAHVVCAWLGNTQAVAAKHYLQVTAEHYETAQKTAQSEAVIVGRAVSEKLETAVISDKNRLGDNWTNSQAPRVGLEPTTQRLTAACSTN